MRILQILPEMNAGGVERGTLEIGRFLAQQGHEALVVSNGGRMVPELEAAGVRHITMPVHRKNLGSLFQVRPLRGLMEREQPDILHIRSRVPGWIAWLAWRKLDPRTRPRLVSTVHGFYSVNRYSAIMTRGDRVIAVSESIRDYVLQNYRSTAPEAIRVIPRGIDPTEYPRGLQPRPEWLAAWRKDFPEVAGQRVLTLPGRITRLKGHEDFFRLLQGLQGAGQPAHGLVVGDVHPKKQHYLGELKTLIGELGLTQNITFTGHRADLREILAVSDAVFSLSTKPESFGRTSLEALALGRPVVGYDHGGVGEQLRSLFPAGRVPPGDAAALLGVTQRILGGGAAPTPVIAPYTLEAMCRSTLETYQQLLGARNQ
jgi:glycosyltransferase involved in cell wall biosynthesis